MLFQALNTSNTGVNASQDLLNTAGNNLANLNTTAFKANQVSFQDLFYATLAAVGVSRQGPSPDVPTQSGYGVLLASTSKSFTQGPLQSTGNPLDVALNGPGFFQVTLPDGSTAYTRTGTFVVNANGRLVTSDGNLLQPPIVIPAGTTSINIASDGTVTVFTAASPNTPTTVGQITLTRFVNPPGLTAIGTNLYRASANSGSPTTSVAGQNGTGTLNQGFLEGSNVDATTELTNLLIAQQSFVFNAQALTVEDQMLLDSLILVQ
jgi:flagellar basal-body rod protein FlgG